MLASVFVAGLSGARARAADPGVPAPLQPYDPATPEESVPSPPPLVAKPVPPAPPPAQAVDGEAPRRQPRRLIVDPDPLVHRQWEENPSEPGLIFVESLLGFLATDAGLIAGAVAGGWPILFGPLVTGGLVCAIGNASSSYDGSCGAAIGGAYLGSLLLIPMALVFNGQGNSDDEVPTFFVGALLGYVVGTTVGAVVGWNVSRARKPYPRTDVARLDAVAAARALPWREPLRPRGSLLEGASPPLTAPMLTFRF